MFHDLALLFGYVAAAAAALLQHEAKLYPLKKYLRGKLRAPNFLGTYKIDVS